MILAPLKSKTPLEVVDTFGGYCELSHFTRDRSGGWASLRRSGLPVSSATACSTGRIVRYAGRRATLVLVPWSCGFVILGSLVRRDKHSKWDSTHPYQSREAPSA
jgi:hypothetical protein